MQEIIRHLSQDTRLKTVIENTEAISIEKNTNPDTYSSLLRAIVGQQLSTKAAQTIYLRFEARFGGEPQAEKICQTSIDTLKEVGLSQQKAGYIQNIARFTLEKGLSYALLAPMTDAEIITYLTQIKGVGKWTVEMLLMSGLGRLDVFPEDDLGIQQAMSRLYGLDTTHKKTLLLHMRQIASVWSPYRTIACKYLWKWKDKPALQQ